MIVSPKSFAVLLYVAASIVGFFAYVLIPNSAAAASVTLTVNDGAVANVLAGSEVLLEWHIPVSSNCSINNGVGIIPGSEYPSGSRTVVVSENSTFTLTCTFAQDSVVVGIIPQVTATMTPNPATTNESGEALVTINWNSEYADSCSIRINEQGFRIRNYSSLPISGTRTYSLPISSEISVICTNLFSGAVSEFTNWVEVIFATPSSSIVTLTSHATEISKSLDSGLGQTQIVLYREALSLCYLRAFDSNNAQIAVSGLPSGTGGVGTSTFNVQIATTTLVRALCYKEAQPEADVSNDLVITLTNGNEPLNPMVATITAPELAGISDLISGTVDVPVSYSAVPTADLCYHRAYDATDDPIIVPGWTNRHQSFIAGDIIVTLSTTTRLQLECYRAADESSITREVDINVVIDLASLLPPVVEVSNERYEIFGPDFTERTNYALVFEGVSEGYVLTPIDPTQIASAETSFLGASGNYNVYVRYCDELGTTPEFTLQTDRYSTIVASWVANRETLNSDCGQLTNSLQQVANVSMVTGDTVTISCDSRGATNGQSCRFSKVVFLSTQADEFITLASPTDFASQTLFWESTNVSTCGYELTDADTGEVYMSQSIISPNVRSISLDNLTVPFHFTVSCIRISDGATVSSQFYTYIDRPVDPLESGGTTINECTDSNNIITGSGGGPVIPIPTGFAADSGNICVPEPADVYISSYSVSEQSTWIPDHTTGSHDNVELRMVFTNRGPASITTPVPYRFDIRFNNLNIPNFVPDATWIEAHDPAEAMESGASSPILRVVGGVPFGTHLVRARINQDPVTLYEGDAAGVADDNEVFYTFFAPPPGIPMTVTVDRSAVRRGQSAMITWNVESGYEVSCDLLGPGVNERFDLMPMGGAAASSSGTAMSRGLNNTSEFVLTCTEPTTNTAFTRSRRVEVSPSVIEI